MLQTITSILAFATIAGQAGTLIFLMYWLIRRTADHDAILLFFRKYGIGVAFAIALAAVVGNLYYSEIANFIPCKLCWLQRIFMYPQVLLLGIAWWKKDYGIKKYSLPLALIGFGFALYHSYLQQFPATNDAFCSIGSLVGCSTREIYELGYITMPLMSLTAFLMVIVFVSVWRKNPEENRECSSR